MLAAAPSAISAISAVDAVCTTILAGIGLSVDLFLKSSTMSHGKKGATGEIRSRQNCCRSAAAPRRHKQMGKGAKWPTMAQGGAN